MEKPEFPDYGEEIARVRTLVQRGTNMFSSAFAVLDGVRKDLGDEKFADWCFYELQISASILFKLSEVLKTYDAAVTRENLRRARDAEKEKKRAEREAKKAELEAAVALADRQKAEKEKEQQKAESREKRKERSAVRAQLARDDNYRKSGEVDFSDLLTETLADCNRFAKSSHIEYGRYFNIMQQEVQNHRAGKDPATGKWWGWRAWCSVYLAGFGKTYVHKCIEMYSEIGEIVRDADNLPYSTVQPDKRVLN